MIKQIKHGYGLFAKQKNLHLKAKIKTWKRQLANGLNDRFQNLSPQGQRFLLLSSAALITVYCIHLLLQIF